MPDRPNNDWQVGLKPVHLNGGAPAPAPSPAPAATSSQIAPDQTAAMSVLIAEALSDLRRSVESIDRRLAVIEKALSLDVSTPIRRPREPTARALRRAAMRPLDAVDNGSTTIEPAAEVARDQAAVEI